MPGGAPSPALSSVVSEVASECCLDRWSAPLGVDQEVQHLPDGPFPGDRVTQRKMLLDLVAVPTSGPFLHDVALLGEVGHYAVGRTLGDVEGGGDVTKTRVGVVGDEKKGSGVVGEEAPVAHAPNILEKKP